MARSNICPRCGARCVVATAHQVACLACGHEQRDLPTWLEPTHGNSLLPTELGTVPGDDGDAAQE